MLCCKGTNNSCWVRVPSSDRSGLNQGQTKVCYCDEYCESTGDCCPDLKDIKAECQGVINQFEIHTFCFHIIFVFSVAFYRGTTCSRVCER